MLVLSALKIIENALNRFINLDNAAQKKLAGLAGKVVGVSISGLSLDIFITFHQDRIFLQRHCLGQSDLYIKAPPFTLLELMQAEHVQKILQQEHVEITGDVLLAQKIKILFQGSNIDWTYYMSLLTGDVLAQQSSSILKNSFSRLKKISSVFKNNVSEYLQEEINVTPNSFAVEIFCNEVDELRSQVDLLSARISRLEK